MSTRETVNRGFDAVAITAIRYRCSAGVTSGCCLNAGRPVGTKITSSSASSAAASLAATRLPWWMGSKVPPITPILGLCSVIAYACPPSLWFACQYLAPCGCRRCSASVAVPHVPERVRHHQQRQEHPEGDHTDARRRDPELRRDRPSGGQQGSWHVDLLGGSRPTGAGDTSDGPVSHAGQRHRQRLRCHSG